MVHGPRRRRHQSGRQPHRDGGSRKRLVSHEAVAEAAVIGKPHRTAGEAIKAFVILKQGYQESKELVQSPRTMC